MTITSVSDPWSQRLNLRGLLRELGLTDVLPYITVYQWVRFGKIKLPEDAEKLRNLKKGANGRWIIK